MPILPPISTAKPKLRKRCATSAVVVDFPFVPVIATKGEPGAIFCRSRQNNSMSPIISTPACLAFSTVQCGAGCVNATPGERTSDAKFRQSASARFSILRPAARAFSRACSLSSQTATRAPPATRAWAVTKPEPPSPNTAACLPLNEVTGVIVTSISRWRDRSARARKR